MHVVFPTTPAQYFHLLRRQMKRNFRKPLILAGPKGLLRLSAASSSLADMEPGTRFQPVLDDPVAAQDKEKVKRVVMLSGKVYYELIKARHDRSLDQGVAFIRIEELAPFPFDMLESVLKGYENAKEWVWVQEEPRNQGAWGHVVFRIESVLQGMGVGRGEARLRYVGRRESAVPAPGVGAIYQRQQGEVIRGALEGMY
ncbi:uncharacterized protein LACBIDRAFT_298724 [Laccaria bicolor S238N-H82]|uniref:Predicted protein n=1 Tax=Laccaria bicolor (strain S238N-H82 / ATCC MYA-4686) TaxID=486041 RepID=B0DDH4_LACBS|nr:uncharacterized protein LACBIDRAFT_298724 [Laccaria bicolor S238N-H82]EDR07610.1 predicted protein [Laccaria bicolor S238N-H82]|eukprot:XP_001882002.1 predicted protein [Laccaria bicolor S238N-H82]